MSLKKLSIIFSIALLVFVSSINITSAIESLAPGKSSGNEYIKDLNIIDNSMYITIKLISTDSYNKEEALKQVAYSNSLLDNLNSKISKLPTKDDDIILSVRAILNFYKLSLLKAHSYIKNNDTNDLIDAISSFTVGSNASNTLSKIINEAGK
ncbi:hypothetical protein ACOV1W_06095 [Paraclostridium bifermentans]|uniref:hypothetical protein n=1 Tax=Paraclostridium bifermentans TaxID=1490 RepID=UPI003D2D0C9F